MKKEINFRRIQASDDFELAKIIRTALEEYDEAKPGTVYTDPTTDALFELFSTPKSAYFIAEVDGEILGGCGIFPTLNLPDGYAELVKIYLKKEMRGLGVGRELMNRCIDFAKETGYTHLYLESFPSLKEAIQLYRKMDFKTLSEPLGDSGHFACDVWMVKAL